MPTFPFEGNRNVPWKSFDATGRHPRPQMQSKKKRKRLGFGAHGPPNPPKQPSQEEIHALERERQPPNVKVSPQPPESE
jgi:hypothetical protein